MTDEVNSTRLDYPSFKCKSCGRVVEARVVNRPDTIHKVELKCLMCNKHIRWAGKLKLD